jgi:small subunit ribosomal protein S14
MKFKKVKDFKIRSAYLRKEKLKKINKFLFTHFFSKNFKENSKFFDLNLMKLQFLMSVSKVNTKNRCILTNRNKGVNKFYSISRIIMRDLCQFGLLPGFKKAVW